MAELLPYALVKQSYTLPFDLREFQEVRVDKQALLERTGLYWDVGTGKTSAATVMALYKKLIKGSQAIVLMPPILLKSWLRWLESIKGVKPTKAPTAVIYRGTPAERRQIPLDRDFTLMTIQVFKNDFEYLTRMFEQRPVTLVVDEATSIKNVASQNYKRVRDFLAGV